MLWFAAAAAATALWCWLVLRRKQRLTILPANQHLLLVIAHPDDESMFFLPTVLHEGFQSKHVLCLSNGNYDGMGRVRERELNRAAIGVLEFDSITFSTFMDGPHEQWSHDEIASVVKKELDVRFTQVPVMVVTFDRFGCSGHINHVDTHFGVKTFAQHVRNRPNVTCWELVSDTFVPSKFSSFVGATFGVLTTSATTRLQFVNANPITAHRAMAAHYSQYVWYRKLFLLFFRGVWINSLNRV